MKRNKNNTLKIKMWQKTMLFFVAFFSLSIAISSCKKKQNPLGKDVLPPGSVMSSAGIDTFQVFTYTVLEDSVNTMDPEFNLIGSYHDDVFGAVEASFYTQLTLSGFSPEFGDLNTLEVDSAVFAFEYGGYYGTLNEQLFEVYEITEELTRDSSYTRNSELAIGNNNLVPTDNNQGLITPNTEKLAVVGTDTLNPQLRIPIDKAFAKHLLTLAESATSDASFLEDFKGLHLKVNNPTNFPGQGSIVYLATSRAASKLTVYYTSGGQQNKFDFIVTNSAIDFNRIQVDYSGTKVQQVIDQPELGGEEFYAQAFVSRAKMEFESINNIPENVIIHSATLEVPVSFYQGDPFYISSEINVGAKLFEGDERIYALSSVAFNTFRKAYVVDLRTYIQNIIKGEIQNNGIYISPRRYNTSAERIIFNGANSTNKKQPKLNIVYTEL